MISRREGEGEVYHDICANRCLGTWGAGSGGVLNEQNEADYPFISYCVYQSSAYFLPSMFTLVRNYLYPMACCTLYDVALIP